MSPGNHRQYSTEQERLVALEVRLDSITSDISEIFRNTSQQSKVQTEHTVKLANIEEKLDGVRNEILHAVEMVFASFKPKAAVEEEKKPFAFISKSNSKILRNTIYTVFTTISVVWGFIEFLHDKK